MSHVLQVRICRVRLYEVVGVVGMYWIMEAFVGLQWLVYLDMGSAHLANSWMNLGGMNGNYFCRLDGVTVSSKFIFWLMWLNACRIGERKLMFIERCCMAWVGFGCPR